MGIVSFRPYGRMGNFLFMAANCIAYAMRNNMDFSIPYKTNDGFWNPIYLSHLIHPNYKQGQEDVLINQPFFHYAPIEFKEEWRDKQVILNGYYQSEKWFEDYRTDILFLFNYPYEKKEGYVAVHVRRGDYIFLVHKHPPVTKAWYESAMSMFHGMKFIFYSDDIRWCKDNFGNRSDCEFSSGNIEQDLIDGSCCEHQIISASTYGWWMAWLNRNEKKKVYIPEKWFTDGWDGLETKDVVPDWMNKLPNL